MCSVIPAHQYLVSSLIPEDHTQEKAALMSALLSVLLQPLPSVDTKSYCATSGASPGFKDWLVLTEVDVFHPWPLGVGDVLAKGLQNLLLYLAERVCVHGSDTQGVHPAALEGDVEVLQAEAKLRVTCPVLLAPNDARSLWHPHSSRPGALDPLLLEIRLNKCSHLGFTASERC